MWIGLIFSRHLNVPRYDVYSDQSVNIEGYMSLQSMRWRGWSGNLKTCLQNAEEGDIFEICNTVSVLSLEMARRENIESTDSKCFCFQKSKD